MFARLCCCCFSNHTSLNNEAKVLIKVVLVMTFSNHVQSCLSDQYKSHFQSIMFSLSSSLWHAEQWSLEALLHYFLVVPVSYFLWLLSCGESTSTWHREDIIVFVAANAHLVSIHVLEYVFHAGHHIAVCVLSVTLTRLNCHPTMLMEHGYDW